MAPFCGMGAVSLLDRTRRSLKPTGNSKYLNNRTGQDRRRIRSMLGFKSRARAGGILSGIEMVRMTRKRQVGFAYNPRPSIADRFEIIAPDHRCETAPSRPEG